MQYHHLYYAVLTKYLCVFRFHEEEEDFRIDQSPLLGSSSHLRGFDSARVKPTKSSIQHKSAGWLAPITASAFNRLGLCANSPGNGVYYYAELAVSSLAVAVTIASTPYAYPQRDGQAELAWMAWLNTKMVYLRTVTHLSTNPARRRVTSLMRPTMLPLSQTARFHGPV